MMHPPDSLKARILEAAKKNPVPARKSRVPMSLALAAAAVLAMLAVLDFFGGPHHADGRPTTYGSAAVGCTMVVAALASFTVLPRRRSMLPRSRAHLLSVAIGVPLLVGLCTMLWHPLYDDPFERLGVRCFAMVMLTAPWPFIALSYARDRIDPVSARLSGAAMGAASGAWAAVMVALWCPLAEPGHVLRAHVLPVVVLSLAGAVLGTRLFGLRRI